MNAPVTTTPPYVLDVRAHGYDQKAAVECLGERGFVVLRGMFEPDAVRAAYERIHSYARRPAIAGVPGYSKVDHPKRLFNPFALGGSLVDMVLDERAIDIAEAWLGAECVLFETNVKIDEGVGYVYFPTHSDFGPGWRKAEDSSLVLTAEHLKKPVAVGGAIYFHDTTEGAFSYCEGTHRLGAPRGQNLTDYPPDERDAIMAKNVRIEGLAGDFVLFDDRGFHGPDQPSRAQRTVILVDYYNIDIFGFVQVSPMPLWSCDIGHLNARQLRVAGAGATFISPPESAMGARFRRHRLYPLIAWLIEHAYVISHLKARLKAAFVGKR